MGAAIADGARDQAFSLPQEVVSAATAFDRYMAGASGIDSGFADSGAVAQGLKTAASYEPSQMEEGMVAYGAILALQDDRFVAGVERAGGDDRAGFSEQLVEDPFAVTRVEGADEAARRIEAALGDKAQALLSAGTKVKAAAYSVQSEPWSKVPVDDAEARLADVKTLSGARAQPTDDDNQTMVSGLASHAVQGAGAGRRAGFTPIEARALALAAESVLGRAHGADRDRLSPLFSDADTAECLRMAKLNLYQCMAVAGPQYEDIFCMGQHAMSDTAKCVAGAAAQGPTAQMASLAQRPPNPTYVPLAAHRSLAIDPN
jgi:hypothetical protein